MQLRQLDLFDFPVDGRIAVTLDFQHLDCRARALGRVEHQRVKGVDDDLDLVDQVFGLAAERIVRRRVAAQAVGQQYVLELLHQQWQHAGRP